MHSARPRDYHSLGLTRIQFHPPKVTPLTDTAKVTDQGQSKLWSNVQPQPEGDVSVCDDALDQCYVDVGELDCVHSAGRITNNAVIVGGKHFCCMLDTGAQVSLMDIGVLNQFSLGDIVIHDCDNSLVGLGNDETKVGGYLNLKLRLYDHHSETLHPFAVVAESTIPVCFILGANFLAANNLDLDFSCGIVSQILADKTKLNCMMSTRNVDAVVRNFDVTSFLGSVSVDQVDSGKISDSEISSDGNYNIVVSRDDMTDQFTLFLAGGKMRF